MLSIAKLSPGQEAYYERSVAAGLDDYYAGRGESPGVWTGEGARGLGLTGAVGEGDLSRLIDGRDPATGTRLRRHPARRVITVERLDPLTGAPRLEERTLSPVAGFDLVFSAPKSVSLLHALGGDGVRYEVDRAHRVAWQAALGYLEREACVTRRGRGGAVRERAGGFVAAAYQHRTSRAGDPQLHTHVIVGNLACSPDGAWRALDGDAILRTYRLAAGYLYQAQLRHELTRALGVEWEEPDRGLAEIRGVPAAALQAFSRRRAQIVSYLGARGTSGYRAAQVAAIETRDRKVEIDMARARAEWRSRAAEHGLTERRLRGLIGRVEPAELSPTELASARATLLGEEGLTATATSFRTPDVLMAWAQSHRRGAPANSLVRLAASLVRDGEVIELSTAAPGQPARYSLGELVALERRGLRIARTDALAPAVGPCLLATALDELPLTLGPDQVRVARAVAGSGRRAECVIGLAGAGKTATTAAIAAAFGRAGVPVLGAAPSGIAAERLAADAGIPTRTLHGLLGEIDRRGGLPASAVVIVDEAGMADTRSLVRVLEQVERCRGKAILIGDPAQLPAVGPGGMFAAIAAENGALALDHNRRQPDPAERAALARLRAGDGAPYLALAAARGRLRVAKTCDDAKAQLVGDWWSQPGDPNDSVMLAYRRADIADLNAAARDLCDRAGLLGDDRLRIGDLELAPDDRIVCLRNDRRIGVSNGTRGRVVAIDAGERSATIRTEAGTLVELPARYLQAGHVQHGYALTGHRSQGLTVERAFVLLPDRAALKEWGYVALSRARGETRVYLSGPEREHDIAPGWAMPERPALDRLVDALRQPAADELASSQLERALDARRRRIRDLVARRSSLALEREHIQGAARSVAREQATLGPVGRLRHGGRLREEQAGLSDRLATLAAEVRRLDRAIVTERRALNERARVPRSRTVEPAKSIEREPPSLGR